MRRLLTETSEWVLECRLADRFGGWGGGRQPKQPGIKVLGITKPAKRRRGGTEHTGNRG